MSARRPRLLDLFCGAGGASVGYHRAGFDVVGVDIEPHPDYPFPLLVADALEFVLDWADAWNFDAIHASPPCQRFSTATGDNRDKWPDLIESTRQALDATGLPWVIENVPQAPLQDPIRLCGSSFGLAVRRHRHFESNVPLVGTECRHQGTPVGVYGQHPDRREHLRPDGTRRGAKARSLAEGQAAMGIDWMTWPDLVESIPPAYTEHIGRQLLAALPDADTLAAHQQAVRQRDAVRDWVDARLDRYPASHVAVEIGRLVDHPQAALPEEDS